MITVEDYRITKRPLALWDCAHPGCVNCAKAELWYRYTSKSGAAVQVRRNLCIQHLQRWMGRHVRHSSLF